MPNVRHLPIRRNYAPNENKLTQLFLSGFIATVAMTAFAFILPILGVPSIDYAALGGAMFNGRSAPEIFAGAWWLGLALHLALGVFAFSLSYDYLLDRRALPQEKWIQGLSWGGILWLLTEVAIKPLFGEGIFSRLMPNPLAMIIVSLATWLVYGITLEAMTRVKMVHEIRMQQRRAA